MKWVSSLLVAIFLLGVHSVGVSANTDDEKNHVHDEIEYSLSDQSSEDLENRLKHLKSEVTKLKETSNNYNRKMNVLESENRNLLDELSRIDRVMGETLAKISDTKRELLRSKEHLDELNGDIAKLEKKLKEREVAFRDRVSSASSMSFMNYFEVVVKADSFGSMLTNLAGVKKVMDQDNRVIEEYIELSEQLADAKIAADKEVIRLDGLRVELTKAYDSLEDQKVTNEDKVDSVVSEYKRIVEDLADVKLAIEEKLSEMGMVSKYIKLLEEYGNFKLESEGDFRLHPLVDVKRMDLIKLAELKGIRLITTSGLRTFAEQDALYAKGRTSPGDIVTNARAGESWHNYGVAFDVAFDNGSGVPTWEEYDMNDNGIDDWDEIGEIGDRVGLEWGGTWKQFLDRPHFQYTFGKSMSELREVVKTAGKSSKKD